MRKRVVINTKQPFNFSPMQHEFPKPLTFENLLANAVQELNFQLHTRSLEQVILVDKQFAEPLASLLVDAGYDARVFHEPVTSQVIVWLDHEKCTQSDELVPKEQWPTNAVVPKTMLVTASDLALCRSHVVKTGVYDPLCGFSLQTLGFSADRFQNNHFGLFESIQSDDICIRYDFLNFNLIADDGDSNTAWLHMQINEIHCNRYLSALNSAGYTVVDLHIMPPHTALVQFERLPTQSIVEWDFHQLNTQLLPANTRLSNACLLRGLYLLASNINKSFGRQYVSFPLLGRETVESYALATGFTIHSRVLTATGGLGGPSITVHDLDLLGTPPQPDDEHKQSFDAVQPSSQANV